MLLMAAVYAHLLLVLDDDDFYTRQTPFTLSQQRAIAATLNSLLYHSLTTASADDQVTRCDREGETAREELPSRRSRADGLGFSKMNEGPHVRGCSGHRTKPKALRRRGLA